MKRSDLHFEYPESLVAIAREPVSRVMVVKSREPHETTVEGLLQHFQPGDVLVLNDTKVIRRRVFGKDIKGQEFEVLFIDEVEPRVWRVLFPASRLKTGELFFPGGVITEKIERGRLQVLHLNQTLSLDYFEAHGELPLPPYIQKSRGERHNRPEDKGWYQTEWARVYGSQAAPTASLHFRQAHLERLRQLGVTVVTLTLHVGLGTFMPIDADDLDHHVMHSEEVSVPSVTWNAVTQAKSQGRKVWALGTTVTRALESVSAGILPVGPDGGYSGRTEIFLRPPVRPQVVDNLLTNFHQPESTLLALVASFAGLETVKSSYQWAIERKFRLFSYGDLTAWIS